MNWEVENKVSQLMYIFHNEHNKLHLDIHNCRLKLLFSILSIPAVGYKSSLIPKHHKRF